MHGGANDDGDPIGAAKPVEEQSFLALIISGDETYALPNGV